MKQYEVRSLEFNEDWMILEVDGQKYQIAIAQASKRLANASEAERKLYRISPSGYGIHWIAVDEDLSIAGLLKIATKLVQAS